MIKTKGIIIKNIYYMLAYAFNECVQGQFDNLDAESFEHTDELFALLLERGLTLQIKRGLYREYIPVSEDLQTVRGKIDLTTTIRNRIGRKNLIACEFDELSPNNTFNKILKTALVYLIRNPHVESFRKGNLRTLLMYFDGIDEIEPSSIQWHNIKYHRNNSNYKLLINICYLLLNKFLPSDNHGEYHFQSLSESNLNRLYEKFVLNYYALHHPKLHPVAERIPWNLDSSYDNDIEFLPAMKTDISLSYKGKYFIIDTKFYGRMTQQNFDKNTIHSGNLYQIFTYVKNKDLNSTGNVSGLLLYAKTEESIVPDMDAMFGRNRISVKTLDLNTDFVEIKAQLDSIASFLYS